MQANLDIFGITCTTRQCLGQFAPQLRAILRSLNAASDVEVGEDGRDDGEERDADARTVLCLLCLLSRIMFISYYVIPMCIYIYIHIYIYIYIMHMFIHIYIYIYMCLG